MTRERIALGAAGENVAAAWYLARGYEVIARNWRCTAGELDLIARRGGLIVFCEVKTRSSDAFGAPIEAVGPAKQRRLRVLGAQWLRSTGTFADVVRYDVVSVLAGVVEVFEDVV